MQDTTKRAIAVVMSGIGLVGLLVLLGGLLRQNSPLSTLRIAITEGPQAGLILLADHLGYFKENGIDAQIQSYGDNLGPPEALSEGSVDLAAVTDIAAVEKFVRGEPVMILSQLHNAQRHSAIIVRKESGILRLRELKGRHLAVSSELDLNYFLSRAFLMSEISSQDVAVDVLPPEEAIDAFRRGKVSAIALRRGAILDLVEELGTGKVRIINTASQLKASVLLTYSPTLDERRPDMERTLQALAMAYEFYLEHRDSSYLTLLDMTDQKPPSHLMQVWAFMNLDLSLSNVLLMKLREQQAWLENTLDVTKEADIERSFATELLRQVRPDLVTVM